ncbi:MAG: hypothetical protein ACR2OO_06840 [Thermomicrobiales bacterium]
MTYQFADTNAHPIATAVTAATRSTGCGNRPTPITITPLTAATTPNTPTAAIYVGLSPDVLPVRPTRGSFLLLPAAMLWIAGSVGFAIGRLNRLHLVNGSNAN